MILEVRLPDEPAESEKFRGPRFRQCIAVRNTSADHNVHFKWTGSVPPGESFRAGGMTHLTLAAGDDRWIPIYGDYLAATVWATREHDKKRDPMDDGMGGW